LRIWASVNPVSSASGDFKSILEILSDPRYRSLFSPEEQKAHAEFIPWTRSFVEGRTDYRGTSIDTIPFVRSHKDDFVLKPNDGYGGFGVLVEPGAPGIGRTVKFGHSGLVGVCLPFGPIPTRDALADPALRRRINELGGRFVDELQRSRGPELFMQLSRRFAEHVGLITPRLRAVLERTDEAGIPCSMAMFGEVAFSLLEEGEAERLVGVMRAAAPDREVLVVGIDDDGARLT